MKRLFLSLILFLVLVSPAVAQNPTTSFPTADGFEDNKGRVDLLGTKIKMGKGVVGLRFPLSAIPANATITTAYLSFMARKGSTKPTTVMIDIEIPSLAPLAPFSMTNFDLSTRIVSGTGVNWIVPPWIAATSYNSPSLVGLVQSAVGRPEIVFLISGQNGKREFLSLEAVPPAPASLFVDYTVPVVVPVGGGTGGGIGVGYQITSQTVYTFALKSGKVAILPLTATAGEIFIGGGLLALFFLSAFNLVFKVVYR